MKVIKSFGYQQEDIEDFRKLSEEVVEKNIRVAKIDSLFDPTISFVVAISYFLSIVFGAKFIIEGAMTVGDLVAFTTYLGLLVWPMLAVGMLFNIVERGSASYDRIEELLTTPIEMEDRESALDIKPSGVLIFNVQSFTFPGEETATLKKCFI